MPTSDIRVGILSPSSETREVLRAQIQGLGNASVVVEVDQYCAAYGDRPTRRLAEARPHVVVVEMQDAAPTLLALQLLHATLPESWLFVVSGTNDPQLIIDAMRTGAREYLLKPVPQSSLSQAFGRYLADRKRHQQKQEAGSIYCVTAVKGGAGATTLAINLAACVAEVDGARPAIADLNGPLGDAAGYLNLSPKFTLSEALASAERLDGVLLETYMCRSNGIAVLPGPREVWTESGSTPATLGRVLEVLVQSYTHTFADLAASLDRDHVKAITDMASAVIVVLTSDLPALWRAQRLLTFLATCGSTDKVRLVLNRSHRSDQVSEKEIVKTLGQPIYWKLPNNYASSIRAVNSGKPLVGTEDTDLTKSYLKLAHDLTGIPLPQRRRGLLGLFSLAERPSNA